MLSTKTRKQEQVRRHIVTSPLAFNFNSVTGAIVIGPGEQSVELSLELDMLETSERPDNSDSINDKLSELNSDFWTKESLFDSLSSWVNRFDSEGQFYRSLGKDHLEMQDTTLSFSPAIIFRKRGEKNYSKFFKDTVESLESDGQISPCISHITDENQGRGDARGELDPESLPQLPSDKYYFPLPVNEEQRSIINKLTNNIGVVVQGPPGTGKTHSIANLICHLLASGKKLLITSQTDRALKVLKNKLPDEVKALCVEILGQDQKSLLELTNSVNSINSKYQEWDSSKNNEEIERLEKKDNDLKGSLVTVEGKIIQVKHFEAQTYENLFDFYSGTATDIARQIKREEQSYSWILDQFEFDKSDTVCPITKSDAKKLLNSLKKIKNIPDSVLEDPLEEFSEFSCKEVLTESDFMEKIRKEEKASLVVQETELSEAVIIESVYNNFSEQDFDSFFALLSSIILKSESLVNSRQDWVDRAMHECISGRVRSWGRLLDSTQEILDSNKDIFLSADKIRVTHIPDELDFADLSFKLNYFFDKFSPNDKVRWGLLCSKEVRMLKKIIKNLKIDGHDCNSYQQAQRLEKWVFAKIAKEDLLDIWNDKVTVESSNFGATYHEYKDLYELLEKCLELHKLVNDLKSLFNKYQDIPEPQWSLNSLKQELKIAKVMDAKKTKKKIEIEFKNYISLLSLYKGYKGGVASKVIDAYRERCPDTFSKATKSISDFENNKKEFQTIAPIKRTIDTMNGKLLKSLRENIDDIEWESKLENFEESWAWYRAKIWIKENGDAEYLKELSRQREDLVADAQRNLESLVAKKAWGHCLSKITLEQQANLKGWAQAVSKIGKGTGKTAPKHKKVARDRMSKCKGAIPAWIMPLYRVVENVKPDSERFDVAIIDEASQTGPEGLLLNQLAKKIIVVGDNEQISPEMPGILDNDVELLKKKYLSNLNYSDHVGREYSYYDYCDICFSSQVQLREHFRCMPEIIQFSNELSYSGKPLYPMRPYGSSRLEPLKNTFVEGAVSKIGSAKAPQNDKEAEAIVNQLKKCTNDPAYENKTFGIISLQGNLQVKRIEKFLEKELDKEVIEKREITVGDAYDFQGDERDVMFLSMGISKDYKSIALTKSNFKKSYNVAASRAKDQMWLFHSVQVHKLSANCFRRKLLSHCISYKDKMTVWPREDLQKLRERIKETKNKTPRNAPDPFDSWFEAKVFLEIANRGYLVHPQFEASSYRIDMVIMGANGRLAVECDGDIYHAEEHEERDLNRQWNLERCGWTFWRVRSSLFYSDEEESLRGLWSKLEKMKIFPIGQDELSPDIKNPLNNEGVEHLKNNDEAIAPDRPIFGQDEPASDVSDPLNDEKIEYPKNSSDDTTRTDRSIFGQDEPVSDVSDPLNDEEIEHLKNNDETITPDRPIFGQDEPVPDVGSPLNDEEIITKFDITETSPIDPRNDTVDNISKGLLQVIKTEGPILTNHLYRLYSESCGVSKVGKKIKKKLNKAIDSLQSSGLVVLEQDPTSKDVQVIAFTPVTPEINVRERTDRIIKKIEHPKSNGDEEIITKFDITETSPVDPRDDTVDNISKGLLQIIKSEGPILTNHLYRLYSESCGVSKVGKKIKKKLNKAIDSLQSSGLVVLEPDPTSKDVQVIAFTPVTPEINVRERTDRIIKKIEHPKSNGDEEIITKFDITETSPIDPRNDTVDNINISKRLLQIIKSEGPILTNHLYRLYSESCGVSKVGKKIKKKLNKAIDSLQSSGLVVLEQDSTSKDVQVIAFTPVTPEMNVRERTDRIIKKNEHPKSNGDEEIITKFDITETSPIDPRNDTVDNINISKRLLQIIKSEGPVLTNHLYRLYSESCGVSKVDRKIKKKLNKTIYSLQSSGLVIFEKESTSIGMQDGIFYIPLTPKVNIRQSTDRRIDEIPLSELKKVMNGFKKEYSEWKAKSVFRATLEFYGLKNTLLAQQRLKSALNAKSRRSE